MTWAMKEEEEEEDDDDEGEAVTAEAAAEPPEEEEEAVEVLECKTELRRDELIHPPTKGVLGGASLLPSSTGGCSSPVSTHRTGRLAPINQPGVTLHSFFGRALAVPEDEPEEEVPVETKVFYRAEPLEGGNTSPSKAVIAEASAQRGQEQQPDLSEFRVGETSDDVPSAYVCALTLQVITEPVLSPHGDVFERAAILKWLRSASVCPITGNDLVPSDLIGDTRLRQEIVEWKLRQRHRGLLG
eukprot:Hpha_TRINITY_DN17584_c0_g1::TRINITY_DN17584_c0_g1_i1::g.92595::m.92595